MPDSLRSCGVLNAPAQRITSRAAEAVSLCAGLSVRWRGSARYKRSPARYSTPMARRCSSNITRVASACVRTTSCIGQARCTRRMYSRLPTRRPLCVVRGITQIPSPLCRTKRQSLGSKWVSSRPRTRVRGLPSVANDSRSAAPTSVFRNSSRTINIGSATLVVSHPRKPWRLSVTAGETYSHCSSRSK